MAKVRFGSRLRLGMIVPSVNSEAEPQIEAMLPDGVTLHTTRLKMVEETPEASLNSLTERIEEGASLLQDAGVDRILFHCTAVTMFDPEAGDRIAARILGATGLPVTVTAHAVRAALQALGARQVVLVAPYVQEVNDREEAFLRANGIGVLRNHALGMTYAKDFRAISPEDWHLLVSGQRDDRADAYFLSCAQIRVAEIIGDLERELDRPVVTSNQAAAWHAVRESGIADPVEGFRALFERC